MTIPGWISADWPAPANIKAGTTTRVGGVSQGQYTSFNLAQHVEDDISAVQQNRRRLTKWLGLSSEPRWLNQVHGCDVSTDDSPVSNADAIVTSVANNVCAVMTADCLPVLFCDQEGTCVAAAHAGWRGLAAGVIEHTLDKMPVSRDQILVWLGPAIGPDAFEVGSEVKDVFVEQNTDLAAAFRPRSEDKWLMDIYVAARILLMQLGIGNVYGGGFCTYAETERFYSYRRDRQTGRMVSLIWMDSIR